MAKHVNPDSFNGPVVSRDSGEANFVFVLVNDGVVPVWKRLQGVPTRPTGAHRQGSDFWNDPNVVIVVSDQFGRYIECPRVWDDGMAVGFEYIRIPSDF